MQTYVINLDRSPERLAFMDRQLEPYQIGYQRVSAVDGKTLSRAEIDLVLERLPDGPWPSTGEVACFLSHRRCWHLLVASGKAYACIFEDDIEISPLLGDRLRNIEWIPRNADIVKIETYHETVWLDRRLRSIGNGIRLGRLRSQHHGCAGYIVSRDAALKLLALTERFSDPIDVVLFHPGAGYSQGFAIYQTVPALCVQTETRYKAQSAPYLPSTLSDDRSRPRFRPMYTYPKRRRKRKQMAIKLKNWVLNRISMKVDFDPVAAKADSRSIVPA